MPVGGGRLLLWAMVVCGFCHEVVLLTVIVRRMVFFEKRASVTPFASRAASGRLGKVYSYRSLC
jgi:hypothetical protein